MSKNGLFTKAAAAVVSAALILLSPGNACYSALAGELAGAAEPAAPRASAAPRLDSLALPAPLTVSPDLGSLAAPAAQEASPASAQAAGAAAQAAAVSVSAAPASAPLRAASSAEEAREARLTGLVDRTVAGWETRRADDAAATAAPHAAAESVRLAPAAAAPRRAAAAASALDAAADLGLARRPSAAERLLAPVAYSVAGAAALVLLAQVSPLAALVAGAAGLILLHEAAHLWTLRRLGDRTAEKHGVRSPLDLLDWRFTAALPAATALLSSLAATIVPAFPIVLAGWAKQIPVDFNELRGDKRRAAGLASLAGPAMNAALAVGLAGLAWALPLPLAASATTLVLLAKLSLGLTVFNLLPLPHLDGGKALVALMPQSWYARWLYNDRVPQDYQGVFGRLYEGPSALLNFLSMTSQKKVNALAAGITFGLFVAASVAGWAFLQAPLVLMMLVCSYDYYCIREKVQNEEATRALQGLIQGFAYEIAAMAEADDSIESEINPEQVEHSLKNAFENTMDSVVDSEGFEQLTAAERWQRLEAAYLDAATAELKRAGMSADTPETIRRVLESAAGQRYREQLKAWVERYDVFRKWHSPGRKAAKNRKAQQGQQQAGEKTAAIGAATKAVVALAVVGGAALMTLAGGPAGGVAVASAGLAAVMAGTLAPQAPAAPRKTFYDALNDPKLRFDGGTVALVSKHLKDMTAKLKAPVIGRDAEMERVLSAVTAPRGDINSVILLGDAGVGKTAVAEKLAQAIVLSDTQPEDGTFKLKRMEGRYLVELDVSSVMKEDDPLKTFGTILETIRKLNDADDKSGNKVIVFMDEIHKLFVGNQADQMAAALLTPLRDGELTVIAATTQARYKALIEKHDDFKRRLKPIRVEDATDEQTRRALEGRQDHYEALYDLRIDESAFDSAINDSRLDHELHQPGRSFNYLIEALREAPFQVRREKLGNKIKTTIEELQYGVKSLARRLARTDAVKDDLKNDEPTTVGLYNELVDLTHQLVNLYRERAAVPASGEPVVAAEDVQKQISLGTDVPMSQFSVDGKLAEKFLGMEAALSKRVIGQPEAVKALANALKRNAAGLSDPTKPIGVFYLNGPTGSGKTHLARETARYLFDDPDAMIRLDMSEYMEKHTVAQLKGAPPGYVGYDLGGQLTEQVRRHPYSVILFDEIEKSHPDIWMILLQIMGSARLTDGQGRTVDFSHCLLMMTSNLGMQGLDLDAYVKRFSGLQEQKARALEDGNQALADMLDKQMYSLATELADVSKKEADAATVAAFKGYPPEFRGRLSYAPIVMNRVTPEMAVDIAENINLPELADALAKAGHRLEWDHQTKELPKLVVNEGYDVELGARPIQNAVDRMLKDPIADEILNAALKAGGKVGPMRIVASVEKGRVKFDISQIVPEPAVKKRPEQGPAQEVFGRVLTTALEAAARGARANLRLQDVDEWVRRSLSAFPDAPARQEERQKDAAPAAAASPAAAPAAATAPRLDADRGEAPVLGSSRQTFAAAHYEHERKDQPVRAAKAALKQALEVNGFDPAVVASITRTGGAQAAYDDFVTLMVEQAKRATPQADQGAPVEIAFEVGDAARVVVRRPGRLDPREEELLRAHFTGSVPSTSLEARGRAEQIEVTIGGGSRLWSELYRKLARIPGARLGWTQTSGGVEYWIEIPKGPPDSPPTAAQSGEQAGPVSQAEPRSASEAGSAPAALLIESPRVSDRTILVELRGVPLSELETLASGWGGQHGVLAASDEHARVSVTYPDAAAARQAARQLAGRSDVDRVILGVRPDPRLSGPQPSVSEADRPKLAKVAVLEPPDAASAVDTPEEDPALMVLDFAARHDVESQVRGAIEPALRGAGLTLVRSTRWGDVVRVTAAAVSAREAGLAALALTDEADCRVVRVSPAAWPHVGEPAGAGGPAELRTDPEMADRQLKIAFARLEPRLVEEALARLAPAHHSTPVLSLARSAAVAVYPDAESARRAAEQFAALAGVAAVTLGGKAVPSADDEWRALLASKLKAAAPGALKANNARVVLSRGGTEVTAARSLLKWHGLKPGDFHPESGRLMTIAGFIQPEAAADALWSLLQDRTVVSVEVGAELYETLLASPPPPHVSAPRRRRVVSAETLAKIEAAPAAEAGSGSETERRVWAEFRAASTQEFLSLYSYVKPALEREGLEYVSHQVHQGMIRVQAKAASAKDAGERAYRLAEDARVSKVILHPAARPFAQPRPERLAPEELAPMQPSPAAGPRGRALALAAAILAQGDERSPSVRTSAADLFAAAASDADLAVVRDWIALERIPKTQYHVAAAAQALGRLGDRSVDEPRLLRALGFIDQSDDHTSHMYQPTRRRAAAALARLLDGVDARRLVARYRDENAKRSRGHNKLQAEDFEFHQNHLISEGILLAILRSGDPAVKGFVLQSWRPEMAAELHDYLKRVDPDYLRRLYEAWRAAPPSALPPQGTDRVLTPFAVADFGDKADALKLYAQLSTGWNRLIENNTAPLYARPLGELVARTGAMDELADNIRKTLKEGLNSDGSFHRMMTAVVVAAEAGDERHLPMLERLMRINPQSTSEVHYLHEMTQHEAAEGWARLAHRLGLTKEYLSRPRQTANGEPAPPLLQSWLADRNPLINIAGLEALRLLVARPEPPRPSGPARSSGPARPIDAQTLLFEGPAGAGRVWGGTYLNVLSPENEATRFELRKIPDWKRALADEWLRRTKALVERLLGAPFAAEARVYNRGQDSELVWALRQASGAIPAVDDVNAAADALAKLILVASKPQAERAAALAALPVPPDEPEAFLELLRRLEEASALLGIEARAPKPGYRRDEEDDRPAPTDPADERAAVPELWLRFGAARPAPAPGERRATPEEIALARNRAHGREFDVDPITGRRLYDPGP